MRRERSQIISKLAGKFVRMSQHKYASNVVEKCLEHGDTTERELIIEEIMGQSEENDTLLVCHLSMLKILRKNMIVIWFCSSTTNMKHSIKHYAFICSDA